MPRFPSIVLVLSIALISCKSDADRLVEARQDAALKNLTLSYLRRQLDSVRAASAAGSAPRQVVDSLQRDIAEFQLDSAAAQRKVEKLLAR